ncbi:MAG TPA: glucosyl-3-phosphoglycerate synthase [Chloroflexota bacterium]|nr:glucosyl-3-phosphoglycerate synthase [Chloroflexota bacterium]
MSGLTGGATAADPGDAGAVYEAPMNVLLPAEDIATLRSLLPVGGAVVSRYGGRGTALSVVEIPEDRSLSEGALIVRRRRQLLARIVQIQPQALFQPAVVTARSVAAGIRDAVRDSSIDLLLLSWRAGRSTRRNDTLENLVEGPPCNLAAVMRGGSAGVRRVLVPVRGGPHAQLALAIAEAVAAQAGAELTLLHVDLPEWSSVRRDREQSFFEEVRVGSRYDGTRFERVVAGSVQEALLRAGSQHDVVVMGAAARDQNSPFLFGRFPHLVARKLSGSVIVAKTREPVTAGMFRSQMRAAELAQSADISELVDRWFAENTFHSHEFRSVRDLVGLKERQGKRISVVLPALNEEKTIGKILTTIQRDLVERQPLVDELIVVDSNSADRTVEIAQSLGVAVYRHPEILPEYGTIRGKGEALWKSLYVTTGDIIVWIDSDITGIHPKFVYGLVGPLLTQPRLGFVKGFYRRPLNLDGNIATTGGGRVTELTARPLINLFYPALSGVVQPLAGEMAGRREVLEKLPFFTGYGVETGLLVDILDRFGLRAIAQSDLEERIHRNQTLLSLSQMAFAIVQVVIKRLGQERKLELAGEISNSMKLIHYSPTELFLEIREIHEGERPPIESLPEYRSRMDSRGGLDVPARPAQGTQN